MIKISKNNNNFKRIIFKFSFKKILLIIFLLSFFIALYIASGVVKSKGYSGLYNFVSTVVTNYKSSWDANPEKITIEIKDKDFKKLEKNRKKALERGVIINDIDGDYVSAVMEYNNKKINVKLRLKGHMTDHLQDNKWSFRIKVKEKDETFMGMKRFSIQHPGTRGYIYEWIYHELMKREGVIALRYKFINVSVNGKDWGIYAVEENFENELLENNNRLKGPILRFNPDLYWVNRYNEYSRTNSVDEFASYYSANPEAYREDKVLEDTLQKKYYLKGIALIEGLRSKTISVDDAFDIPQLAKFHAIIDLVGGIHSIDWSDIKYYYNPVTAKLEPVAYESFTNLQMRDISCQYLFIDSSKKSSIDWHELIFSNPTFFKEYIKNLERISNPEYLNDFFTESNNDLKNNLAIINKEFPYKKFDVQGYYKRQNQITKVLNPPKAIHAYFDKIEDACASLQIAAIDALPVEIKSIEINNNIFYPEKEVVLPCKQKDDFLIYKTIKFKVNEEFVWNDKFSDSLKINYSILGSSTMMKSKIFPFPHTDSEFISEEIKNKSSNLAAFPFIKVEEKTKTVFIEAGKYTFSEDLIIPKDYTVYIKSGANLNFIGNSKMISYSAIIALGEDDYPIIFESSDSTFQGVEVIKAAKSVFKNVVVKSFPKVKDKQWKRSGSFTIYESAIEFENCSFYNAKAEDAINIIRSNFMFKNSLFKNMKDDALDVDFSEGNIENCVFEDCSENAIDATKSNINIKSCFIKNVKNKGINIKDGSNANVSDVTISDSYVALSAEDYSNVTINSLIINNTEYGLVAYKNKPSAGHATIICAGFKMNNVKEPYLREKKSFIVIDNKNIEKQVDDVELIIKKSGKKKK